MIPSFPFHRRRVATALVLLLASPPLMALDHNVCPRFENHVETPAGREVPDVCYAGFRCVVGLRGDWLDVTDRVSIGTTSMDMPTFLSAQRRTPRVSIGEAGADVRARESCVPPSRKSREGYVAIEVEDIAVTGWLRVTAARPGPLGVGRHQDGVDVEFRDGRHFLHTQPGYGRSFTVTAGRVVDLQLTGRGLDKLRVKAGVRQPFPVDSARSGTGTRAPGNAAAIAAMGRGGGGGVSRELPAGARAISLEPAPFEIVSKRFDSATVRVNVLRDGSVDLGDYFEFADADPAINRDFGWPQLLVRP